MSGAGVMPSNAELIAEIKAAPPRVQQLILAFLDLLLQAQEAGKTLPPLPDWREGAGEE